MLDLTNMVISDIIAAIAASLSAIALWVSYRAFVHTKIIRFEDKFMDLRLRIVELRNKAALMQTKMIHLGKRYPEDIDKEMLELFDSLNRKIDELHNKMFKKPLGWDSKFLDDRLVEIREVEGDMNRVQEKLGLIFKKV